MKIVVKNTTIRTDHTKDGNPIYKQRAALDLDDGYPLPFFLVVRSPENAYAPGLYDLAPEAFRVSPYGSLEIDRYNVNLIPQKEGK